MGARAFSPRNWTRLLNVISITSIHACVASSDNEELYNVGSKAIDVHASWNGLLGKHLQKMYNFLELAFKTGREKHLVDFRVDSAKECGIKSWTCWIDLARRGCQPKI